MLIFLSFLFALIHDYHISQGQVNYNSKSQKIEISMQLFIDDMEKVVNNSTNPKITFENQEFDALLKNYIQKKVIIKSNQQRLPLIYIGKEMTKDMRSFWIYLETNKLKNTKNIELINSMLIDTFDDQTNIIEFLKNNSQIGYFTFDKRNKIFQPQF